MRRHRPECAVPCRFPTLAGDTERRGLPTPRPADSGRLDGLIEDSNHILLVLSLAKGPPLVGAGITPRGPRTRSPILWFQQEIVRASIF